LKYLKILEFVTNTFYHFTNPNIFNINGKVVKTIFKSLKKFLLRFIHDTKGAMSTGAIIGIGIGLFLFGIFFPLAMTEIMGANTTGWPTGVTTIFQTALPILGIIAVAVGYIRKD